MDILINSHILSTILFTPLVGAILLLFIPRASDDLHRVDRATCSAFSV